MEEKKQFIELLKPLRRQLLFKRMMTEFHYWMLSAAAFSLVILLTARFFVLPFYHELILCGWGLLFAAVLFRLWRLRPDWRETAHLFNEYIPDDRVVTAYSFLDQEGLIVSLQRSEVLRLMKKEQHTVLARKKHYVMPKWLLAAVVLGGLTFLLNHYPNQTVLKAGQKEKERAVLNQTEKKLEQQIKKEKKPLAKKELEKAKTIIENKKTPEVALAALSKQMKELELKALKEKEKQDQLKNSQEELKSSGLNGLAKALSEKDASMVIKEINKLNKNFDSLTDSQKKALGKLTGTDKQLTDKDLAALKEKLKAALNAGNLEREVAAAQSAIADAAQSLQKEMAASGLNADQIALNPSGQNQNSAANGSVGMDGQEGNGAKADGSNVQTGKGNGTGSTSGNGKGPGDGTGSGNGSGTGGTGGNGNGNGNQPGNGAGFGTGSRYFLTVPEKTDGKTNIEKDAGTTGKGNPSQQYEGNGPVLKGSIRSYREVYADYLASYRKSTDRVRLPSDLETIVKNYFTALDPNKE